MTRTAKSIAEVVTNGLCIGCGLCESITHGRVTMEMTTYGSLRPTPATEFSQDEEAQLLSVCPGVIAEARVKTQNPPDIVWGASSTMRFAWAGDSDLRFRAATGGVLTALAIHALRQGLAEFVFQVGADPAKPMRSRWTVSETEAEVIANAGSRYGPTAPLAGLETALNRKRPFVIIAKPCDLGALHQLSKTDPRVNTYCIARLAMVCGGQSRLTKSSNLLSEYNIKEEELSVFRYRGYGNPGKTRIETRDGRAFEKTYLELWEDEASWQLETRCKLCPDALGEAADIAAADVWPGGSPSGEDAGFNGIIVRSSIGDDLVTSAENSGDLKLGDTITSRQLDNMQPHQVRKKNALSARYAGLEKVNAPVLDTSNLRITQAGVRISSAKRDEEMNGTIQRVRNDRFKEPLPQASSFETS